MITKVTIQNFKRFKGTNEFATKPDGVSFLAGGNNSGKSTLLQALAVWEFSKSVIQINKGNEALLSGGAGQGVGVSTEEFSPIALPDLKHLWSNLKVGNTTDSAGYTLKIRCDWTLHSTPPADRHLEIGLALANDRLFLKRTASNVQAGDSIPRLAYLPPFAGIGPREERMSPAARKRWIGRGLAGAVLRNLLYDFWQTNCTEREKSKSLKGRISKKALATLRKTDSWEQLMLVLEEVFKTGLSVAQFNELYNTTIDVACWDGELVKKNFRKKAGTSPKDLMVEGSGFLQWLSVYLLALHKDLDVLLLDEPDAHLHPALQGHLIHKLGQLARENNKQVLLATHSTTILAETRIERVLRMEDREYLKDERGRVALFVGLGSEYAPRLDQLKRTKRLFLYDGPSDLDILQSLAKTLGIAWSDRLVCWKYTKDRTAREVLFDELRAEIPGLKGISLQDRDDYPWADTKADLTFDNLTPFAKGLGLRRWRRRNIENYLLWPAAIARAMGDATQEPVVQTHLQQKHGLAITADFTRTDCPQTLCHTNGKDILTSHADAITAKFGVDYRQVAAAMQAAEIPDDVKVLLGQLRDVCQ